MSQQRALLRRAEWAGRASESMPQAKYAWRASERALRPRAERRACSERRSALLEPQDALPL